MSVRLTIEPALQHPARRRHRPSIICAAARCYRPKDRERSRTQRMGREDGYSRQDLARDDSKGDTIYEILFVFLMRVFQNTCGSEKYISFVRSYLLYRQSKQMLHSKSVLRDFLILEMSNLRVEPIRFNSTTFSGKLDLLDHIVSYTDKSPDVLAYQHKMQVENPAMWPK